MGCIHQTLSLIIQASVWKRNAKDGKSQRWWRTSGKLSQTQQDWRIFETAAACIWTPEVETRDPRAETGWLTQCPTLAKKLFAVDVFWERRRFSPVECHWVYQPHSQVTNFATLTPCFYLWTFCFVLAVSVLLVCCLFVLIFVFAGFAFYSCLFDVGVLKGQRYSMIHDVKYKLRIQLRRTICLRCPFANLEKKITH